MEALGKKASSLFISLVLGERDDPNDEALLFFKTSGSVHVLALSGLHLGILSGLLLVLLVPVLGKRTAASVSIIFMSAYTFIAGPFPSMLRAYLMSLFSVILSNAKKEATGLHMLFVSFIVLVSVRPDFLMQLSTQLSYLALAGIIIVAPAVKVLTKQFLPDSLASGIGSSVGSFLFTLPVVAKGFDVVYPAGIIAGLVLVPLVTVFIWLGLAFSAFAGIPHAAACFSKIIDWLYSAILFAAKVFSLAPEVEINAYSMLVFYAAFIVLFGFIWIYLRMNLRQKVKNILYRMIRRSR